MGLIHPVTGEFNHKAVIEHRGGRWEHEHVGNTKDWGIDWLVQTGHHYFNGHKLGQDNEGGEEERPKKMYTAFTKAFDRYDLISFIYGGILALQSSNNAG